MNEDYFMWKGCYWEGRRVKQRLMNERDKLVKSEEERRK